MLDLYQFELSHYCEKVRLLLDYKGLDYRKIEVTPGVGQIELFQMSGQRQVPVLKDGTTTVADSTAIARYLDRQYPTPPIIPTEPKQRGLCLLMEEWADASIGLNARKVLLGAVNQYQDFRTALLPSGTPSFLKGLVGAVPGDLLSVLSIGVGFGPDAVKMARETLRQDLEALCLLLQDRAYLISDTPTLADFAVAGLTMYLKFPAGVDLDIPETLRGRGIPGLADDPEYAPFFEWRDRLYQQYRKSAIATQPTDSKPTPIDIE